MMLPFTLCLGTNLKFWAGLVPVCIVPGLKYHVILDSACEVSLKSFGQCMFCSLRSPVFSYWLEAAEIAHPVPKWVINIKCLALG